MNNKTRIVKKEYTYWDSDFNEGCIPVVQYKLQYQKSFLGFKYWVDFVESFHGFRGHFSSIIWMDNKDELITRFNCSMSKIKYTYE